MKNLIGAVEYYLDFLLNNEEYRMPEDFKICLADAVINYWRMLLFVIEGDLDDAAKAEESLIDYITTDFTDDEKTSLQKAAQLRLQQGFLNHTNIDPENESLNREQRFLTFIASGRFEDMDLL